MTTPTHKEPAMAEAWFCDENVNVLRGEAAAAAIKSRSDAQYFAEGQGITRIPKDRWTIAQTFERTGWMEKWRGVADDRNLHHAEDFNFYRPLVGGVGNGRTFKHAIELGCGPFTNLRVIGDVATIEKAALLDPLVESYLQLPKCRYTREALKTHSGERTIPLTRIHACPIEEMDVQDKHDLVVMMNVIEHCYDVHKIFDQILAMTTPGSMFVFHDCIYDVAKTKAVLTDAYYEAGHPLMVGYDVLKTFMRDHFHMTYFSRMPEPPDMIEVSPHVGRFFFIGERK